MSTQTLDLVAVGREQESEVEFSTVEPVDEGTLLPRQFEQGRDPGPRRADQRAGMNPRAPGEHGNELLVDRALGHAPERTLLEKALILHAAIHRGRISRQSSRHAYDLAMLHRDPETMAAVGRDLYERVAFHKFVFGENSTVRDAPRAGIRLVPTGDVRAALEADYRIMQPMFFTDPPAPSFADVLAELTALEATLRRL